MNEKKKKYVEPNAEVIDFINEDIITLSALDKDPGFGDEDYEG